MILFFSDAGVGRMGRSKKIRDTRVVRKGMRKTRAMGRRLSRLIRVVEHVMNFEVGSRSQEVEADV